ncbi:hypothetical protein QU39_00295, partial [Staphylococcus aureus]
VELDHQVRLHLHRIRHLVEGRHAREGDLRGAVRRHIVRDVALGQALRLHHQRHFLRLGAERHGLARLDAARANVALLAVDQDVAVVDQLAGREDRWRELGAIDDHVEALLEQADEVLRRIALHLRRVLIGALELLLGDVAVIALELLLGAQL